MIIKDKAKTQNLVCYKHNKDSFIKYCNKCKTNLCYSCFDEHKDHEIIEYKAMEPDKQKIKDRLKYIRKNLDLFNENINQITAKLNKVKENLEIYFKIYKDIYDYFEKLKPNERNYETYQNVNEINNNYLIEKIKNINNCSNLDDQIKKIVDIYNRMVHKNLNIEERIKDYSSITKIITCEKCYNIPKILIMLNDKVKIECSKCKTTIIKDISYFDKFLSLSLDKNSSESHNCSYNKEHKCTAAKYCFNCKKYLCDECIKSHNNITVNEGHLLFDQKIENEIYCNKNGHNNYKIDRYCQKCEDYLCPICKCQHENDYFKFNYSENQEKVEFIKDKLNNCEKLINIEEENLKNLIKNCENKSEVTKKCSKIIKKEI